MVDCYLKKQPDGCYWLYILSGKDGYEVKLYPWYWYKSYNGAKQGLMNVRDWSTRDSRAINGNVYAQIPPVMPITDGSLTEL